ncbi:hypothetical protein OK074_6132 [Actinobacteria bacterium OK074]|nr:hypothetical protein OK074_6132 [Actinobacteria bacterium OK074]
MPCRGTAVAGLNVLVDLAAGGVGLAVVLRRAIDRHQPLDVCEVRDPWARRHHLLAWDVDGAMPTATAALADHLRQAAMSDPTSSDPPGTRRPLSEV